MQFILITFLSSFVYFDYIFLLFSYLPITPSFSFFFFFNDTAPPEISPLSLHDALPISRLPVRSYGKYLSLGYAATTHKLQGATAENAWVLAAGPLQDRQSMTVQASRHKTSTDDLGEGDRKSTRLNSSHQIISYAVFCLK